MLKTILEDIKKELAGIDTLKQKCNEVLSANEELVEANKILVLDNQKFKSELEILKTELKIMLEKAEKITAFFDSETAIR